MRGFLTNYTKTHGIFPQPLIMHFSRIATIFFLHVVVFSLLISPISVIYAQESTCSRIEAPRKMSLVTDTLLNFHVDACDSITSVNFKMRYTDVDGSIQTVPVGTISRRPFKLIYPVTDIPNQLTQGITCLAECVYETGDMLTLVREGVFLLHHPFKRLYYPVHMKSPLSVKPVAPIVVRSPGSPDSVSVQAEWDGEIVTFNITVASRLFYSTASEDLLSRCGVTLCFDPSNRKDPFISEDIVILRFPVKGAPTQLRIRSGLDHQERLIMQEASLPWKTPVEKKLTDFKGFTYSIQVPISELNGVKAGDTLGCSIIATVFNSERKLVDISWREGGESIHFAPVAFGVIKLEKHHIDFALILIGLFSFLAGIGTVLLPASLLTRVSGRTEVGKFEASEKDAELINQIDAIINSEITNINFSIGNITAKLSIARKKVTQLIRKKYHESFDNHILKCRLEIVKERLRSSNSSESSIAKGCGFNSIEEMEKRFKAVYKISPYRFRESNRVN